MHLTILAWLKSKSKGIIQFVTPVKQISTNEITCFYIKKIFGTS